MKIAIFIYKKDAIKALEILRKHNIDIEIIVFAEDRVWTDNLILADYRHMDYEEFSKHNNNLSILENVEYLVSYLFPKKLPGEVLTLPCYGSINFHPAPLPEYRGLKGCTWAILNEEPEFGVSCHYMDKDFDTGDIIKVKRFAIDEFKQTAFSLNNETKRELPILFEEIIEMMEREGKLPSYPQDATKARYYSDRLFEKHREIKWDDDYHTVTKKIRAYFCPPYKGAYIRYNDKKIFPLTEDLMSSLLEDDRRYSGRVTTVELSQPEVR